MYRPHRKAHLDRRRDPRPDGPPRHPQGPPVPPRAGGRGRGADRDPPGVEAAAEAGPGPRPVAAADPDRAPRTGDVRTGVLPAGRDSLATRPRSNGDGRTARPCISRPTTVYRASTFDSGLLAGAAAAGAGGVRGGGPDQ